MPHNAIWKCFIFLTLPYWNKSSVCFVTVRKSVPTSCHFPLKKCAFPRLNANVPFCIWHRLDGRSVVGGARWRHSPRRVDTHSHIQESKHSKCLHCRWETVIHFDQCSQCYRTIWLWCHLGRRLSKGARWLNPCFLLGPVLNNPELQCGLSRGKINITVRDHSKSHVGRRLPWASAKRPTLLKKRKWATPIATPGRSLWEVYTFLRWRSRRFCDLSVKGSKKRRTLLANIQQFQWPSEARLGQHCNDRKELWRIQLLSVTARERPPGIFPESLKQTWCF